ncbi:MAG: phosphate ABC transporter permease family protein, partial [Phenylobacterium sp.]
MLTWIALTALLLFSLATYMAGRRRAVAATAGKPAQLHSLPGYYGSYAALWAGVPAALLILLFAMFG